VHLETDAVELGVDDRLGAGAGAGAELGEGGCDVGADEASIGRTG